MSQAAPGFDLQTHWAKRGAVPCAAVSVAQARILDSRRFVAQ